MRAIYLLSAWVLSNTVVEGRLFGWLGGGNNGDNDQVDNDWPGIFLSAEEMKIGRRGLACLQYAAAVQNDPFNDLGIMLGPMTRVLMNNFGIDGLNMVCAQTYSGRKLLAEENGEPFDEEEDTNETILEPNSHSTHFENEERRAQTCAQTSAIYPNNPQADQTYANYATEKFQTYIQVGDLSKRSDTSAVIERIQTEIGFLQTVRRDLTTCSNVWSAINQGFSVLDVPFVDPEEISNSILSFSCVLANDYNDIVISRKYRDLERLKYHDQLIDSAEVKAAFENSKTMMSDVCSVSGSVNVMRLEMEVINAGGV